MNGEFTDVHLVFHYTLSVDSHDSHTNEQVKGIGGVVSPAGLPDAEGGLITELSPEVDQQPAVTEEEAEAIESVLKIREQPRGEQFQQSPQHPLPIIARGGSQKYQKQQWNTYQLSLKGGTGFGQLEEQASLHNTGKAEKCFCIIVQSREQRSQQICHSCKG